MRALKVASRDGTPLSCRVEGTGSPLLLIHGAGNYSGRWNPIFPLFEQDFSIYALDRRGRGESGDASEYSLEREFEDAVSVVDAIGGPVSVLGHSLGGICALEAALRTKNILKLILYEPPLPVTGPLTPRGTVDRLEALLKAGDREGVLTTVMLEVIRMPNKELEFLRNSPAWKERLALAHTLPRELRAVDNYRFDAERFRNLNTPTLLLLGGNSPLMFKASIQALASTLRHNRTVVLEGQQHIAMDTAPKLFAQEVRSFLKEDPGLSQS
jgi:pimeloyl-ACP methyl ester carboxylesterase